MSEFPTNHMNSLPSFFESELQENQQQQLSLLEQESQQRQEKMKNNKTEGVNKQYHHEQSPEKQVDTSTDFIKRLGRVQPMLLDMSYQTELLERGQYKKLLLLQSKQRFIRNHSQPTPSVPPYFSPSQKKNSQLEKLGFNQNVISENNNKMNKIEEIDKNESLFFENSSSTSSSWSRSKTNIQRKSSMNIK